MPDSKSHTSLAVQATLAGGSEDNGLNVFGKSLFTRWISNIHGCYESRLRTQLFRLGFCLGIVTPVF